MSREGLDKGVLPGRKREDSRTNWTEILSARHNTCSSCSGFIRAKKWKLVPCLFQDCTQKPILSPLHQSGTRFAKAYFLVGLIGTTVHFGSRVKTQIHSFGKGHSEYKRRYKCNAFVSQARLTPHPAAKKNSFSDELLDQTPHYELSTYNWSDDPKK